MNGLDIRRYATDQASVLHHLLPLGEPPLDLEAFIRSLEAQGYSGWFTVHQPLLPGQTLDDAIAEASRVLPLIGT